MPLISLFTSNFKPIGNSFRGSGIPTNDFNYTIIPNNDLTYIFIPDNDLFNTFIVDNDIQYILLPDNDINDVLLPSNDIIYTLIPNTDLTYTLIPNNDLQSEIINPQGFVYTLTGAQPEEYGPPNSGYIIMPDFENNVGLLNPNGLGPNDGITESFWINPIDGQGNDNSVFLSQFLNNNTSFRFTLCQNNDCAIYTGTSLSFELGAFYFDSTEHTIELIEPSEGLFLNNTTVYVLFESLNQTTPTPTPTPTITPTPSVTVTLTPTSTPIPVNQILYYNFNDLNTINGTTVTDTFNNINGTLQNSPSTGSTSCGNYIEYDGVDNFLITGNLNPYLNPSNTSSLISIFTWVYLMNDGVIVSEQGTLPPNTNWYDSQIELVNGTLKFAVWPHSSVITSSISTPLNNWHYIGFTYDGATLRAYVNGYLAGSSTGIDRQTPYNYLGGAPLYYSIAGNCPTSLGNGGYGNFRMGTFEVYDGPLSDSTILGNFNSTYSNWNCPTPTPTPTLTITPTVTSTVTPTITPTNTQTPTSTITPTPTLTITPTPSVTPPISLLVHLDSSNVSSYPGTGDTWNNLAGGSNATLYNTPTYSSNYSGYLNFDDVSLEYGLIPDIGSLSTWSIEVWFRLSSSLDGKYTALVTNEYTAPASLNFTIGNPTGGSNISVGFYKAGWQITTGFTPNLNVWYQVVGTYDGSTITQYINGSASGGTFNYSTTTVSGGGVRLMRRWDETLNSGNLVDGDLSIVKIYNRVLTSSEILQSYNNNYSRFLEPTPTPTPSFTPTLTPTPTSTPSSIFTMTVVESGSDVIWTGSGTINITGLTDRGTTSTTAGYNGTMGIWGMGSLSPTAINKYDVVFSSSPSSYGTAGGTPNSSSGDFVAIVPGTATDRSIQVPNGYVSKSYLSNTSTFTNKTLSSMGLTSGTYTYSWGSGATSGLITLQIGS